MRIFSVFYICLSIVLYSVVVTASYAGDIKLDGVFYITADKKVKPNFTIIFDDGWFSNTFSVEPIITDENMEEEPIILGGKYEITENHLKLKITSGKSPVQTAIFKVVSIFFSGEQAFYLKHFGGEVYQLKGKYGDTILERFNNAYMYKEESELYLIDK